MGIDVARFGRFLACPLCKGALAPAGAGWSCAACGSEYPASPTGIPIFIRPAHPLFPPGAYRTASPPPTRPGTMRRLLPQASVNLSSERVLSRLAREVAPGGVVLVIGSGSRRADLARVLGRSSELVCTDVDAGADVDLFCDAHELPFVDSSCDAVVTTAVLEHVLDPEATLSEIWRVLKTGGLVYSEVPFMQQVHEGAYDFTRYTLSGHRRLFRHFRELDSGMVAGPGTALAWAFEHFAIAFFAGAHLRRAARTAGRLATFWLKWFDYVLASRPQAMDGASCTYFYGQKAETPVTDAEIVARYVGGGRTRHV